MCRMKTVMMILAVLAALTGTALGFEWDYSQAQFDLSVDAVLGDEFEEWRAAPQAYLSAAFTNVITAAPVLLSTTEEQRDGYRLSTLNFVFEGLAADGSDLTYSALIARPEVTQPAAVATTRAGSEP